MRALLPVSFTRDASILFQMRNDTTYLRNEGYFIFIAAKNQKNVSLQMLDSLGLYGDCPLAPNFIEHKDFAINDALIFPTRHLAREIIKIIKRDRPDLKPLIALRYRHPITKQFIPVWIRYGKYLWIYKKMEWIKKITNRTYKYKG